MVVKEEHPYHYADRNTIMGNIHFSINIRYRKKGQDTYV